MSYLCPLCQHRLIQHQRSLVCINKHQFDIAKEGYVNLLPVQHKASKDPGDNKEMMQARRRFLAQGYYEPLRDRINALLSQFINENEPATLLDIGSGEGYYTQSFVRENWQVHGLDISKNMISAASKSYKNAQFLVASSHRLPFADESLNAIIRIYAPCNKDEIARSIKKAGLVITVTPGARHLYQLKELIYQDVTLHNEKAEQMPNLALVAQENLCFDMTLTGKDAAELLQMTPFAWRASEAVKATLASQQGVNCEADFMICVYRKDS